MNAADKAYKAAQAMIADVQAQGEAGTLLSLDTPQARALTDLPPDIGSLTHLRTLFLSNTQITDTGLSNLAPLTGLGTLDLSNTQITDLRGLLDFASVVEKDGERALKYLYYRGIPALERDAQLAELAEIGDNSERTDKTLAYLAQVRDAWPPLGDMAAKPIEVDNEPVAVEASTTLVQRQNIEFLIRTAPATKAAAGILAQQLSNALYDIPAAPNSNERPPEFQVFEKIRDILEKTAQSDKPDSSKDDKISELEGIVAALELQVGKLTEQLEEIGAEKSKPKESGFVSAHNEQLAKNIAKAEVVTLTTCVLYGLNYFLGPSSATIIKLIEAAAKAL